MHAKLAMAGEAGKGLGATCLDLLVPHQPELASHANMSIPIVTADLSTYFSIVHTRLASIQVGCKIQGYDQEIF